jgi:hypothetical protein
MPSGNDILTRRVNVVYFVFCMLSYAFILSCDLPAHHSDFVPFLLNKSMFDVSFKRLLFQEIDGHLDLFLLCSTNGVLYTELVG